jgi:hypothetical protein
MNETKDCSDASRAKKDLIKWQEKEKKLWLLIGFCIFCIWIAHNIYTAYEWEISSFFGRSIDKLGNFFKVIFTGNSNPVRDVEFSWWALPFCAACYGVVYAAIRAFCVLGELLPNKPNKEKLTATVGSSPILVPEKDVGAKILAEYPTYNEFVEQFEGFDQLSCNAKREVRRLYGWW